MDLAGGRYQVLRSLGRGGGGAAFQCRDRVRDELVTVKLVVADDDAAHDALRREFLALTRLRHPGLSRVLDVGFDRARGRPYLAARYVDGAPLGEHARGRPFAELLPPLLEVAAALADLDAAGLRHGDVKPDNILVGPGG